MANTVPEISEMEKHREDMDEAGKLLYDRIFANGREGAERWLIEHKLWMPPEEAVKFDTGEYETWQDYCDAMDRLFTAKYGHETADA